MINVFVVANEVYIPSPKTFIEYRLKQILDVLCCKQYKVQLCNIFFWAPSHVDETAMPLKDSNGFLCDVKTL